MKLVTATAFLAGLLAIGYGLGRAYWPVVLAGIVIALGSLTIVAWRDE